MKLPSSAVLVTLAIWCLWQMIQIVNTDTVTPYFHSSIEPYNSEETQRETQFSLPIQNGQSRQQMAKPRVFSTWKTSTWALKTWKPVLRIFLISATPSKIELVRLWVRFSHIESLESRLTGKPINEVEIYFQGHPYRQLYYIQPWKKIQQYGFTWSKAWSKVTWTLMLSIENQILLQSDRSVIFFSNPVSILRIQFLYFTNLRPPPNYHSCLLNRLCPTPSWFGGFYDTLVGCKGLGCWWIFELKL